MQTSEVPFMLHICLLFHYFLESRNGMGYDYFCRKITFFKCIWLHHPVLTAQFCVILGISTTSISWALVVEVMGWLSETEVLLCV